MLKKNLKKNFKNQVTEMCKENWLIKICIQNNRKRGNYQSNKIWTKTLTVGCVVIYEKSDLDHR